MIKYFQSNNFNIKFDSFISICDFILLFELDPNYDEIMSLSEYCLKITKKNMNREMKLIILNKYVDLFTNNCISLRFMLDFLPLSIEFDTVNATVDEIFKLSTKNAIKFISIGLIKSFVSQFLNFDILLVKVIPYFNPSHNYDFHFECLMYISKFYLRNQLYIDFFKILINIPLSEAESSKIFIELSKNF